MTPEAWSRLSQAEKDAAYNNTAAVPQSDELARARRLASDELRAIYARTQDLPYGPGERQRWDLFPSRDGDAPLLVFIHGGYWQKNGREDFSVVASGVLAHGWAAALPGYTLAPQASLSQIVVEIGRALDWLAAYRREQGHSGRVVLAGWSAGAMLAALHLRHPMVSDGLLISGVYDLAPLRDTYLNAALSLTAQEIADLSPLSGPAGTKGVCIAYGADELPELMEQSLRLGEHYEACSVPVRRLEVAGVNHFSILGELISPTGALVRALRAG